MADIFNRPCDLNDLANLPNCFAEVVGILSVVNLDVDINKTRMMALQFVVTKHHNLPMILKLVDPVRTLSFPSLALPYAAPSLLIN